MSAPPYMKLYIADYTADVQHLTCEQDGAYWRLLRAMWRAGGKLPNNPQKLATICGLSLDRWAEIGPDVVSLFTRRGGLLTHKRIKREIDTFETISERRKAAGKAGGTKTASKNNNQSVANAVANDQHLPTKPDIRHQTSEDGGGERASAGSDDWPEGNASQHAKLILAEVGSPWLDPHKSLSLNTTEGRIAAWRRDGASWEHDVLPVVRALCAKQRGPVASWKFFDQAIARSIADNGAALEIPEAGPSRGQGPPSFAAQIAAENAEARRRVLES